MQDIEAIFRDPDDREVETGLHPENREAAVEDDQPFGRVSREVLEEIWEWAWGTPEEEVSRSLTAKEADLLQWFSERKEDIRRMERLQLGPGKVVVIPHLFVSQLEAEILLGTESSRMQMGTLQSELRELRQAVR